MNGDELVKDVDSKLAVLLDECKRTKENPRMIRLIEQVMRLTDVEGERAAAQAAAAEAAPKEAAPEPPAPLVQPPARPKPCPPHRPNVFGTCTKCGAEGIKIAEG